MHDAARRRGLGIIIVDNFLIWGGFFMVVPLIAVHYVDGRGWAAATVGFVLAMRQFVQQGLSLAGGVLADRWGAKGLICAGMLIRGVSFAGMAWADTPPKLLAAALLAALGGACFEAPRSAAIAALTAGDEGARGRFYALTGTIGGIGMTVGTFVGALLLRVDFALVALTAGACFLAAFLVTALGLPPIRVATERRSLTHGLGLALRDRPFLVFTALLMGYWFMWVQLSISLPLAATAVAGTADVVSWLYGLNAGVTVLLQYPAQRLAERRLQPLPILALGTGLMALALGGVALAGSVPALLLCTFCFAVGAALGAPGQQTVTAGLADPAALGAYFGVNALALAVGGGVGNWGGGALYGLGGQLGLPALPWLVFGAVGLGAALGLALLHRSLRERRAASDERRGVVRAGGAARRA